SRGTRARPPRARDGSPGQGPGSSVAGVIGRGSHAPARAARAQRRASHGLAAMETALLALDSALAVSAGYLLVLLWAARGGERDRRRSARRRSDGRPCAQTEREARSRLVVLIPAHDEELGIAETLTSLRRSDYRSDLYHTVV